jgi:hypothetical protein
MQPWAWFSVTPARWRAQPAPGACPTANSSTPSSAGKTSQELEKQGEEVEPALRKALLDGPPLEACLRIERILGRLDGEWLRTQRALEALELAGTSAARKVLEALAGGAPEARRTREAKAVLERRTPARAGGVP